MNSRTTETERAHALAEKHGATSYRNRADTSNPAFGFTLGQLEALISEVEQAARRAPAVPVPQCPFPCGWQNLHALTVAEGAFLAISLNEDEPITAHQRDVVMRVVHYGIEMARTMLAAAPQPPGAAPVQLPEPVAYLHECGKKPSLRTLEFSKVAIQLSAKGYKSLPLYTEQQVLVILAKHGIKTK